MAKDDYLAHNPSWPGPPPAFNPSAAAVARTAIHLNAHLSEEEKRSVLSKLRDDKDAAMLAALGPVDGLVPLPAADDLAGFSNLDDDGKLAWCREHIPNHAEIVDKLLKMPDGPERRRLLKETRRLFHREQLRLRREKAANAEDKQRIHEAKLMVGELMEWIKQPLQLQRPEGSMFASLRHAFVNDRVRSPAIALGCRKPPDENFDVTWEAALPFVVEHDWAAAFKGATDFDFGSFQIPATQCLFEFRITGRPVLVLAIQDEEIYGGRLAILTAFRMRDGWFMNGAVFFEPDGSMSITGDSDEILVPMHEAESPDYAEFIALLRYVAGQVRAVAIALDAEVATTDVKREPFRRNEPPGKRAKKPDYSYHVVSLARRSRAERAPLDPNAEPGTRKRLHFRRGHWRRYATSRTWIKWMLVGDPDLGFVDKHYKV